MHCCVSKLSLKPWIWKCRVAVWQITSKKWVKVRVNNRFLVLSLQLPSSLWKLPIIAKFGAEMWGATLALRLHWISRARHWMAFLPRQSMSMLLAKLPCCAQAAFGCELAIFDFSVYFKTSQCAKSLMWMSVFIHIVSRTHYHNNNFPLRLALKKRLRGTQKRSIESAFAFARAGYLRYSIALGTVGYLEKETSYVPWKTALNSLGFLGGILGDRRGNGYFQVCIQFHVIVQERSKRQ